MSCCLREFSGQEGKPGSSTHTRWVQLCRLGLIWRNKRSSTIYEVEISELSWQGIEEGVRRLKKMGHSRMDYLWKTIKLIIWLCFSKIPQRTLSSPNWERIVWLIIRSLEWEKFEDQRQWSLRKTNVAKSSGIDTCVNLCLRRMPTWEHPLQRSHWTTRWVEGHFSGFHLACFLSPHCLRNETINIVIMVC